MSRLVDRPRAALSAACLDSFSKKSIASPKPPLRTFPAPAALGYRRFPFMVPSPDLLALAVGADAPVAGVSTVFSVGGSAFGSAGGTGAGAAVLDVPAGAYGSSPFSGADSFMESFYSTSPSCAVVSVRGSNSSGFKAMKVGGSLSINPWLRRPVKCVSSSGVNGLRSSAK